MQCSSIFSNIFTIWAFNKTPTRTIIPLPIISSHAMFFLRKSLSIKMSIIFKVLYAFDTFFIISHISAIIRDIES